MIKRTGLLFILIFIAIILTFALDLMLGNVQIPIDAIIDALENKSTNASWDYILREFRLPKAITACFVGAGIATTGLQMQTLFRNPLADTSILGIGHGASFGVACFVLLPFLLPDIIPNSLYHNYWGLISASIVGAFTVLSLITFIASYLRDMISLLIVGIMLGFITASLISVLQYFSDPEALQSFITWTFGSLSGVTWKQLYFMMPIVGLALVGSLFLPKSMNALLLGEHYAQSLGINIKTTRLSLIILTGIIIGTLTAFVGPIAFIGIAVPHIARLVFRTANHHILIPATMLIGIWLMLCCDIISQLPSMNSTLPINSVTAIIGAPIVIMIIIKNKRQRSIF